MKTKEIHQCECEHCQAGDEPERQQLHEQINLVMSRLDEQQRRWYAAVEAHRYGHGGIKLVSAITGIDEKTIGRGQQELAADLAQRPPDRIRLPGGGRPSAKKKMKA